MMRTLFVTTIYWFTDFISFLQTMLMKYNIVDNFNKELLDNCDFVCEYDIAGLYFIYGH